MSGGTMNAERLLDLYEQISEAPDAIARLRTFVLNLAVRGKVGTGIPEERPLEKYEINPEWEWLPENWRSLNFGYHCDIQGGNQPPKSQFSSEPKDGYVRLFQIRDLGSNPVPVYIPENSTKRFCKEGEILIGRYGASVGKIFWAQTGAYNVALAKFIWPEDALTSEFCFLLLKSDLFQTYLEGASRSAQAGFNKGDLAAVNFPLPPLAEQHRIVAKVDELMALCDRLEEARKTREEVRDKLTAASLARLTAPETTAEDFPTHAAFALEALPALTTRPDQIKTLRQTILNLAVRGKLVEQDPADEPGQKLLERMRHRAEVLRQEAGVRKKKTVAPLDGIDNMGLPKKWSAEAFANIIDPRATISYGVLVPGPDVDEGIPFVRAQDLMLSGHPDKPGKVIAHDIECKYARTRLEGGEILLCVVGSIGKLGIAPKKWAGANIARAVARIAPMEEISREFTLLFLRSDLAQTYFNEATRTLAQPTLNVGLIEKLPFPIPPLAEQHRIVVKVDALMALCDRLEAALTTANTTRARLLEALLHEALDPAASQENAA
ncbi:type I restriction enzyme S subunit [Rhodobacter sp. JA431]|uniref:restriction endonuclease subunit S n=1 Tax=Rhodobacter sp. JA431 TaxID=570013 RepID=UPI000BD73BE4|nr:restriction endonuclease subunit S [Rhodobacter sp. JA431]SOC04678.1 type I restriction enzyme S subunit [Rhodobacter sp. JA431]